MSSMYVLVVAVVVVVGGFNGCRANSETQLITSALKMESPRFSKRGLLPTSPHGDLAQKRTIRMFTAAKILNLRTHIQFA
jgi:hypothetical protein